MLLNQGSVIHQKVQVVRRKHVLKFQPVHPRSIGALHIKIGEVIVEDVSNLDAKGLRIAKGAVVNRIHIEVGNRRFISVGMQQGVDFF